MANTKAPSGLSITRKKLTYTFTWKIADSDYGAGQQLQWRYYKGFGIKTDKNKKKYVDGGGWTKWTSNSIGVKVTAKSISFSASDFFPNDKKPFLYAIEFRVKGKRKDTTSGSGKNKKTTTYGWSGWSTKRWDQYCPQMPSISAALDDTMDNVCKFTWNTNVADEGNNNPYTNNEWQSILVKASNQTDGSKLSWSEKALGWKTGTGSRNSSVTFTEDTVLLASTSYTRWVRVRSRGPGGYGWSNGAKGTGCSYWRYAKHVYAKPSLPIIKKAVKEGSLMWIRVTWAVDNYAGWPIDEVTVDYAIGTPTAGLKAPENPSWTTVRTFRDTGGNDEANFLVDQQRLELDQMMWVRIGVKHDRNERWTGAYRVLDGKLPYNGGLTPPSDLQVTNINTETHRADIHVTNNSAVPDSKIAIVFRESDRDDLVVGYLNPGQTDVTVQCPNWGTHSYSFAVYAYQGSQKATSTRGITAYTITANLVSSQVTSGGQVPLPPSNITLTKSDLDGEVVVTWNWTWSAGTLGMEISWSQNPNAWESTSQPETYVVTDINKARWRIEGLESAVWYFRLRQVQESGDSTSYGVYSDAVSIDLTPQPEEVLPTLAFSSNIISSGGSFVASWTYDSSISATQTYAELCRATVNGDNVTYGSILRHVTTDQHAEIAVPSSWETGTAHFLCVRVKLEGQVISSWSEPVSITVADPVSCTIDSLSLMDKTIDDRTVLSLTEMPLTATIMGAGEGDTTTLTIVRATDYHLNRPDGDEFNGYAGETVVSYNQNGSNPISIGLSDLVGNLDDGAAYILTASVTDSLGQVASEERYFEVHWDHQALMPLGEVSILEEEGVAVLRPIAPEGVIGSDMCDIYRLSVDKPELVFSGAAFGARYVDPYPAIGEFGGYRFVFRTANGDYITEDNVIAWLDMESNFNYISTIINFGGDRVDLTYNVDLSNTWSKDFKETKYLGGSIEGDWNPGISRTASVNSVAILATDQETIEAMRRLANYAGVCHIRTRDGSSYDADIQVTESRGYEPGDLTADFSLNITRVDPEGVAGLTYLDWAETQTDREYEGRLILPGDKHLILPGDKELWVYY